nr:TetR family transcriptional regulator [Rhodococcus sp. (in: high G+C Gram-positive bacteria)]
MARWEPGSRERLRVAALELYVARGFEQTTTADIARSVGLTERTFFRYFTDKREVLFGGQEQLEKIFVDGIASAPEGSSPVDAVAHALEAAAEFFPEDHRSDARQRQNVILANEGLRERELLKMARLSQSIASALRDRGTPEPQSTLAAEAGVTVFGVAFRLWVEAGEKRSFAQLERDVLGELQGVITPGRSS